jgi:hypothetical protein
MVSNMAIHEVLMRRRSMLRVQLDLLLKECGELLLPAVKRCVARILIVDDEPDITLTFSLGG